MMSSSSPSRLVLFGTNDDDIYINNIDLVTYYAKLGDDVITNWVNNSNFYAQGGDDTVTNYGSSAYIHGGAGDDIIWSSGDNTNITGMWGWDVIYNFGNNANLNGYDGNDTIYNNVDDGSGYNSSLAGSDSEIRGGKGSDHIVNYDNERVFLHGNTGKDIIENTFGVDAVIMGGSGFDTITNTDSDGVSVDGQWGNDTITNVRSDNVTIDAGDGGDRVTVEDSTNVVIRGGQGSDVITIIGGSDHDVTGGSQWDQIFGGSGSETMHYHYADNMSNGDKYLAGDGFDSLVLHFDYQHLVDLSLAYQYDSIDSYMESIVDKFESKDQVWFGSHGFKLTAGQFEQLSFDILNPVAISVGDVSVVEGSDGQSQFLEFDVSLSETAGWDVSVDFTTAGLTANAIMNADFALQYGTLNFSAGETIKTIQLEVFGDNGFEGDEAVSINLMNAVGASLADNSAIGTIIDDDAQSTDPLAVPIFNSKLDASKVIYLDFDGAVVTNTAWNNYVNIDTINAEAFSKDNDTSSFNDAEKVAIEQVFNRVSEDFNPFNVNVTTDYSVFAQYDAASRLSAVITDTNDWFPNAGGVAYKYVEGSLSEYYKPAWVFSDALHNNSRNIAEATSHELGHNLWLSHDGQGSTEYYQGHGSGDTGWASIMGVGYSKKLTQWSQGEYSNATNQEDDVDILEYAYGFRADDHGNDYVDATSLHLGDGLAAEGIIEQRTDIDIFKHFASDTVVYNIEGLSYGSNLDILANLYDDSGTLLASSNPEDGLNASIEYTFDEAMEVYLAVEGTGKGDPLDVGYTDYGSLGYYSVTVDQSDDSVGLA